MLKQAAYRLKIKSMKTYETLQLGELCRRLAVPYRHARYVLEEDILPQGVDPDPDRGHHRQLTAGQAFWLGMVLRLKAAAVKTPLAAQMADFAKEAVKTACRRLNWEYTFSPFDGELETDHRWFVEVGDLKYIRLVTDAKPSDPGLYAFDWFPLGKRHSVQGVVPVVIVRIDVGELARLLRSEPE
jgi:hypothetical protein